MNYYKLNISKNVRKVLLELPRKIAARAVIVDPRIAESYYWSIGQWAHSNVISFGRSGDHQINESCTYQQLVAEDPSMIRWFDLFGFAPFIGFVNDADWGFHRHVYDAHSHWNLTIFDGERTDLSTVKFWQLNDPAYAFEPGDISFDTLPSGYSFENLTQIDEFTPQNGDIYAIHSWTWHSHTTSDGQGRVPAYLLGLSGVKTDEDVRRFIRDLESMR